MPSFSNETVRLYSQKDQLFYQIEEGIDFSHLAIFDVHGRKVWEQQADFTLNGFVSITDIATGVYVVTLSSETYGKVTRKVTFN